MKKLFFYLLLPCFVIPVSVYSQESDSIVINIFVNRPEKRKQTRWNLFDWMQTKERIKMMDMWLAHNSSNTYMPELTLSAYYTFSSNDYEQQNYYLANMDFYLLPLKFADFGINIDTKYKPDGELKDDRVSAGGLFRIFGNSIQNTSLNVKVAYVYNELGIPDINLAKTIYTGILLGSQLQMYLIDYIGYKADISYFLKSTKNNSNMNFIFYSLKGFLEFKSIRFEFGYYKEFYTINLDSSNTNYKFNVGGYMAGLQISL